VRDHLERPDDDEPPAARHVEPPAHEVRAALGAVGVIGGSDD
jgi:hypothetical protein